MRRQWFPVALVGLAVVGGAALAPLAGAADDHLCIGPGHGSSAPGPRTNPCPGSELMLTSDGTFEAACAWQGPGVIAPDWGSWAEGYEGTGTVCGIEYWFSTVPEYTPGHTLDAYVWSASGDNPDAVLSLTTGVDPGPIAIWPEMSVIDVAIADSPVAGPFFVGFWGNWPGGDWPGWGTGCDINGPAGLPRTKIAPGLGYPTGWHDPSIVFGPTHNVGIGAWLVPPTVPARTESWGAVKALYR